MDGGDVSPSVTTAWSDLKEGDNMCSHAWKLLGDMVDVAESPVVAAELWKTKVPSDMLTFLLKYIPSMVFLLIYEP